MPKRRRTLSPRSITAYNRLSADLAALNYVLRVTRPSSTVSETSVNTINHLIRSANRLFWREAGMPRFGWIDPQAKFTTADFALTVTRLTAAGLVFEERYAHLTQPLPPPPPAPATVWRSADGLPSPHR